MSLLLLGNLVSLLGCIAMIITGYVKTKKSIINIQCVQFALMAAGNLILGGVSGAISNLIGVIRNLISLRVRDFSLTWKIFFIAVQAVLTGMSNHAGFLGWFPVLATAAFVMVMDQEEKYIKWSMIFGEALWVFYDFSNRNYTSMVMDVLTILSTAIGLWRLKKDAAIGTAADE